MQEEKNLKVNTYTKHNGTSQKIMFLKHQNVLCTNFTNLYISTIYAKVDIDSVILLDFRCGRNCFNAYREPRPCDGKHLNNDELFTNHYNFTKCYVKPLLSLSDFVQPFNQYAHYYNTRPYLYIRPVPCKTNHYINSFLPSTIKLQNALPNEIKQNPLIFSINQMSQKHSSCILDHWKSQRTICEYQNIP